MIIFNFNLKKSFYQINIFDCKEKYIYNNNIFFSHKIFFFHINEFI